MAAPAAAVPAGIYITGAAVFAGAAYLMTPAGQRSAESLGDAMASAASEATDSIVNIFASRSEEERSTSAPIADTTTTTRGCDGPHRGRVQVQGYAPRVDPYPIELSWSWNRECMPPLRPEGLSALSAVLLPQTAAISYESAGYRGPAFSRMSMHIGSSPPFGFTPMQSGGWSIDKRGQAVRNFKRGVSRNAPRVDMEINAGRAFGDQ